MDCQKMFFQYELMEKNVFCEHVREEEKTIWNLFPFHPKFFLLI